MKILIISDVNSELLLNHYKENNFNDVDIILAAGDLPYSYLQTIKRNIKKPLFFVKGNHDKFKPKIFDSEFFEWRCFEYNGIRIAGIGCMTYSGHKLSEKQMTKLLTKLHKKIKKLDGIDIVVSHYPLYGLGDGVDESHKGFIALKEFVEKVCPKYFIYGHNHLSYGRKERITYFHDTVLINAYEKYILTI